MIVNVSEAKAKLSKLIDMAYQGEEVIIAKNNLPLVRLVAHKIKSKRKLGQMKGQIIIPDDFLEEDEELNAMFYGEWKNENPRGYPYLFMDAILS